MKKAQTLFVGTSFKKKVLEGVKKAREAGLTEIFLKGDSGPKIFLDKKPKFILHVFEDTLGFIYVGTD